VRFLRRLIDVVSVLETNAGITPAAKADGTFPMFVLSRFFSIKNQYF